MPCFVCHLFVQYPTFTDHRSLLPKHMTKSSGCQKQVDIETVKDTTTTTVPKTVMLNIDIADMRDVINVLQTSICLIAPEHNSLKVKATEMAQKLAFALRTQHICKCEKM